MTSVPATTAAGTDTAQSSAVRFAGLAIGEAGSAARGERLSLAPSLLQVPDTTADGVTTPDIELRAASVRGLSHRHWSHPRQDAYAFDVGEGWWVAAVADGLGSLVHSHIAAHAAAGQAVAAVGALLRDEQPVDWPSVVGSAAGAIEPTLRTITQDDETPVARLGATTLVIVCGVKQDGGAWQLQVASVGDCRCAVLLDGEWDCLADPAEADPSLPASTATDALPMAPPRALRTASATVPPGAMVAVFTDGIGAPFGGGRGQVGTELAGWWATPPHSITFAGQVGFMRRGFHDDRACVAVWLPAEPAERLT